MATAPDKPSISATPRSYSIEINYGLTSFGDPNSGTLLLYKLPITGASHPLDTQTAVGNYSYIVNAGSSAWANTQSSYRVIADNGTLTTNSDDITVVTLPPNFSISGNTIEAFNIGTNSFDVQWHPSALGTKYQVDLYASIDNKNTWTLVAQNIQNATDYTYSFSGLASGTTYTVYTQARDSAGRIVDVVSSGRIPIVTTLFAPKLYGSVNGQTKEVKKLYGSINGQTKEIEKLYGPVEQLSFSYTNTSNISIDKDIFISKATAAGITDINGKVTLFRSSGLPSLIRYLLIDPDTGSTVELTSSYVDSATAVQLLSEWGITTTAAYLDSVTATNVYNILSAFSSSTILGTKLIYEKPTT